MKYIILFLLTVLAAVSLQILIQNAYYPEIDVSSLTINDNLSLMNTDSIFGEYKITDIYEAHSSEHTNQKLVSNDKSTAMIFKHVTCDYMRSNNMVLQLRTYELKNDTYVRTDSNPDDYHIIYDKYLIDINTGDLIFGEIKMNLQINICDAKDLMCHSIGLHNNNYIILNDFLCHYFSSYIFHDIIILFDKRKNDDEYIYPLIYYPKRINNHELIELLYSNID